MRASRLFRLLVPAALVGVATLFVRRVWAYRDPVRVTPRTLGVLVSPSDGQVVYLRRVEQGLIHVEGLTAPLRVQDLTHTGWPDAEVPLDGWLLGLHRGPLGAHFTYAPLDGRVVARRSVGARLNLPTLTVAEAAQLNALRRPVSPLRRRALRENERQTLLIQGEGARVAVVDIAPGVAGGQPQAYAREEETVRAGQKIGFRAHGAHVALLVLREDVRWQVSVGDQVRGAQTPLAQLPG